MMPRAYRPGASFDLAVEVAGNPNGKTRLEIPAPREAERIADPKAHLKEMLVNAANLTGSSGFPHNRRQLLERLDPAGPVRHVPSWQRFVADARGALMRFA